VYTARLGVLPLWIRHEHAEVRYGRGRSRVRVALRCRTRDARSPSSASLGLTDRSRFDMLGLPNVQIRRLWSGRGLELAISEPQQRERERDFLIDNLLVQIHFVI